VRERVRERERVCFERERGFRGSCTAKSGAKNRWTITQDG
jgi:hypothetical protein